MKYNQHHTMEIMYQEYRENHRKNKRNRNIESIDVIESKPNYKIQPDKEDKKPEEFISYYLEDKGYSREAGKAAYLSNLVYTENENKPKGFTKDELLSVYNKENLVKGNVYIDNENGDIYLIWKGTNPLDTNDLLTDANILLGTEDYTERFREGNVQFLKTKDVYNDRKIYLGGHSLAGGIASRVGSNNQATKVFTFNRGIVPSSQIPRKAPPFESKTEQFHFRTNGDIVSLGDKVSQKNEKTINVKSRVGVDPLSQHKMDNFLYIDNTQYNKKDKKQMKKDIKNTANTINTIDNIYEGIEIAGETAVDFIEGVGSIF